MKVKEKKEENRTRSPETLSAARSRMLGLLSKLVSSPAKASHEAVGAEGEDF
jgi:hypothetical protein